MGRIKIEITETITEQYSETVQTCTREVPTNITHKGPYDSEPKVVFEREFVPTQTEKTRERKVNLLTQEIEDGEQFDLAGVIAAINNLQLKATK